MKIKSIDVKYYSAASLHSQCEGVKHIKTLPCLSVVQSTEGGYDVGLGRKQGMKTGKNGAFIAPSAVVQTLTHHVDPQSGYMSAHWIFLDAVVNGAYRLDSVLSFPEILPDKYEDEVNCVLSALQTSAGLCIDLSYIYRLIDILLKISKPREEYDPLLESITAYICEHFSEKIGHDAFAASMNVSVSTLYRKFRSEFGQSPANYINTFRILRASALLETEKLSVKELAYAVGFEDEFYFSKLFKKVIGIPPAVYGKNIRR